MTLKQGNLEVTTERVDFDQLLSGMMALWSRHDQAQHDEQRAALRAIFEERCKPDQPVAFADFELMVKEARPRPSPNPDPSPNPNPNPNPGPNPSPNPSPNPNPNPNPNPSPNPNPNSDPKPNPSPSPDQVGGGEVGRHRALALYHRAVDTSRARGGAEDSISAAVFSEVLLVRARDTVMVRVGVRVGARLTLALSRSRCSRPWGA